MPTFERGRTLIRYNDDLTGDCEIIDRKTNLAVSIPYKDIMDFISEKGIKKPIRYKFIMEVTIQITDSDGELYARRLEHFFFKHHFKVLNNSCEKVTAPNKILEQLEGTNKELFNIKLTLQKTAKNITMIPEWYLRDLEEEIFRAFKWFKNMTSSYLSELNTITEIKSQWSETEE